MKKNNIGYNNLEQKMIGMPDNKNFSAYNGADGLPHRKKLRHYCNGFDGVIPKDTWFKIDVYCYSGKALNHSIKKTAADELRNGFFQSC